MLLLKGRITYINITTCYYSTTKAMLLWSDTKKAILQRTLRTYENLQDHILHYLRFCYSQRPSMFTLNFFVEGKTGS